MKTDQRLLSKIGILLAIGSITFCTHPDLGTGDLGEAEILTFDLMQDPIPQKPLRLLEFKAQAFRETYKGKQTGVYIVDGDTPASSELSMFQFYNEYLNAYYELHSTETLSRMSGSTDYNDNDINVLWNATQKLHLTYCISNSFGLRKPVVVKAMADATLAWESAANIKFTYISEEDMKCSNTNKNVVFDVELTSGQNYVARSFSPNATRKNRNIMIDDTSFHVSWPLTLTGILRHELGHAVGLRHEHTRPESGVCFEDSNWKTLTDYDPRSVMHYPQCNGSGDWSLNLTSFDKQSIAALYGAP